MNELQSAPTKFSLYLDMVWGLLVLFGLAGLFANSNFLIVIAVLCMSYVLIAVLTRALYAYQLLKRRKE